MRAYTYSVHVNRSPAAVWGFLTDLSQAPRWRTTVKSMEVADGGPLRDGAEVLTRMEAFGNVSERRSLITYFEPGRRWTMTSGSNGVKGVFDYIVEAEGSGARVTTTCDLTAHRALAWCFLPIIARGQRKARRDQMAVFKRCAEGALK